MNIFEKMEQADRLAREIEAKKNVSRQKRVERELNKVQSGGRVSSFLKKEAEKDSVLDAKIGLATAQDSASFGQALVQYQNAINDSKRDFLYRSPSDGSGKNIETTITIPVPPNDDNIYVLSAQSGIIQWLATQDC